MNSLFAFFLFLVIFVNVSSAHGNDNDKFLTPIFASEYALNYTITNNAYGFVVIGQWTVDHNHRRERQDSGNSTLQPSIEVKDFLDDNTNININNRKMSSGSGKSWTYNSDQKKCCIEQTQGNQPRWRVDPSGILISSTTTEQVWRTYDSEDSLCVDFHIPLNNDGTLTQLPSLLNWWGNCFSNTTPDPTNEVLVQINQYPQEDWVLKTPSDELFQGMLSCHQCMTTSTTTSTTTEKQKKGSSSRAHTSHTHTSKHHLNEWTVPSIPDASLLYGQ